MQITNQEIDATSARELPEERLAPSQDSSGAHNSWDVLWLLWTDRQSILRFAIAGLLLATALAFTIPKMFTARTQVFAPDSTGGSAMALLSSLSQSGSLANYADMLGMKSNSGMFVGILQSDSVADRIINRFDLRKVYRVSQYVDARRVLGKHVVITADRKTSMIIVSVEDRDPQRAADMANSYIDELNAMLVEVNTSSAHRERLFLEERLAKIKKDLDSSNGALAQFASSTATLDPQVQGRATLEAAAALQRELTIAESDLNAMQKVYAPENIRVQSSRARIAELRRQLQEIAGSSGIEGKSDQMWPSMRKLPMLASQYLDLARQAKIQEAVYEVLTKQLEIAKVEEAKETPTVRIVDKALVPERKSYPPRMLFMFAGLLLGILVGAGRPILVEEWKANQHDGRIQMLRKIGAQISRNRGNAAAQSQNLG